MFPRSQANRLSHGYLPELPLRRQAAAGTCLAPLAGMPGLAGAARFPAGRPLAVFHSALDRHYPCSGTVRAAEMSAVRQTLATIIVRGFAGVGVDPGYLPGSGEAGGCGPVTAVQVLTAPGRSPETIQRN
mgnify:FL=1